MNFLKDARCETFESGARCPFLHYIERRRDKVIQDDLEFKEFLVQQDVIAIEFQMLLGLKQLERKSDFYHYGCYGDPVLRQGFPTVSYILGNKNLSNQNCIHFDSIEFLRV